MAPAFCSSCASGEWLAALEPLGIAGGLLLASLHQAGLATLTHAPSPMRWLNEILDRPAGERAFVVVPVGYAAEGATVPDIDRKRLDEVLIVDHRRSR
jgi:iodotyrosine deiodinase